MYIYICMYIYIYIYMVTPPPSIQLDHVSYVKTLVFCIFSTHICVHIYAYTSLIPTPLSLGIGIKKIDTGSKKNLMSIKENLAFSLLAWILSNSNINSPSSSNNSRILF